MSEPSSEAVGKLTGRNTPTDHPVDVEVRESLRRTFIDRRVYFGKTARRHGEDFGRSPRWLQDLENPRVSNSLHWKYNEIQAWGEAVGLRVFPTVEGVEILPEESVGALMRLALSNPVFGGVGLMEYLMRLRAHRGVSQKEVAGILGVNHATMYAIESSNNPKISTLQRYARALGGVVGVDLEEVPGFERHVSVWTVKAPF